MQIMIDGKLACKIADATRGIYLRAARVAWKECNRRGYLLNQPYPFSNKKNETDKIYIPKGGNTTAYGKDGNIKRGTHSAA